MSTQNDTTRPTMLPSDAAFALMAEARRLRSAYIAGLVRAGVRAAIRWVTNRRTLSALEDLSPEMLADIGLDASALKAGLVRRVDDERTAGFVMASGDQPARARHAAEPHLRAGETRDAANNGDAATSDLRSAA